MHKEEWAQLDKPSVHPHKSRPKAHSCSAVITHDLSCHARLHRLVLYGLDKDFVSRVKKFAACQGFRCRLTDARADFKQGLGFVGNGSAGIIRSNLCLGLRLDLQCAVQTVQPVGFWLLCLLGSNNMLKNGVQQLLRHVVCFFNHASHQLQPTKENLQVHVA